MLSDLAESIRSSLVEHSTQQHRHSVHDLGMNTAGEAREYLPSCHGNDDG